MQTLVTLLTALLPGIVISILTAFVTVRLSLKRFYSERWWERKANAYSQIIESLHHMKRYGDEYWTAAEREANLSRERDKELLARSQSAADEISKATDLGVFLISEKAAEHLDALNRKLKDAADSDSWPEYVDEQHAAVKKCLKDIVQCAKEDLGVT